ncbi:hypothetical protein J6590_032564 [Homalodisca vitripennis]|nr:hypothetical protein J6590_032564 [Homalodisca vitripennis]
MSVVTFLMGYAPDVIAITIAENRGHLLAFIPHTSASRDETMSAWSSRSSPGIRSSQYSNMSPKMIILTYRRVREMVETESSPCWCWVISERASSDHEADKSRSADS